MDHITGVTAELVVEGTRRDGARFSGRVIALAFEGSPQGQPPPASSTWLLVADESRPAPIWVAQADVLTHRLGR